MSISKHDQKLLFILLGLALFLAAYLGVSNFFTEKKADIQSQIDELTPTVNELRGYYSNLDTYQNEISRIEVSVDSALSEFPDDVRSEDMIMYAQELEENVGISVGSLSITAPELIAQFTVPQKTDDGYTLIPVAAMRTGLTISCGLNYEQLKKLIDYIYANPQRTTLGNLSVSYNPETGGLSGTVSMDKYFVTSTEFSYTPTEIPSFAQGTDDPFGTFSVTDTASDEA